MTGQSKYLAAAEKMMNTLAANISPGDGDHSPWPYRVHAVTNQVHKQEKGGYAAHKYISSFVGFAPASDPRLVIAVMIDEPGAGQHYGGAVAAPVFAQVMQGALRLLNVPHDAPVVPLELPGETDFAKEST